MKKTYKFLSAILADKPLTVTDDSATVTTEQLDAFDTLYIGCEKFPYRNTFPLPNMWSYMKID